MPHTFTIPAPTPAAAIPANEDPTSELFGEDILHDEDFQLNGTQDYIVLDGVDVVRAAILRRMVTPPGGYKIRPEYGIGVQQAVKGKLTKSNLDALHQRIIDNLAQEDRIDRVVEVILQRATVNGVDVVKIYVKAQVAGREQSFKPFTFVVQSG
jgi:phage baseplate assembly protein W